MKPVCPAGYLPSLMPWKECNRIDERLRFVARMRDGEMATVTETTITLILADNQFSL